jgi:uncharacterized protein
MQEPLSQDVRMWGMGCHLAGLGGILVAMLLPIPFLHLLPPYVVWRMGREQHPFVDEQGKEALNFQFSMTIYFVTFTILILFLLAVTCGVVFSGGVAGNAASQALGVLGVLGMGVLIIALIFEIVVIIFAVVKAANGQSYRYPFTLRFVR